MTNSADDQTTAADCQILSGPVVIFKTYAKLEALMLITSQQINETPDPSNMSSLLTDPACLPKGEALQLECWTCGRRRKVDGTMYRHGKIFRLGEAAVSVRWITEIDFSRQRRLAFCSAKCVEGAKRKDGFFKARRPKP